MSINENLLGQGWLLSQIIRVGLNQNPIDVSDSVFKEINDAIKQIASKRGFTVVGDGQKIWLPAEKPKAVSRKAKNPPKPEWLKHHQAGTTSEFDSFHLVLEELEHFALVMEDGHSGYVDRGTGSRYFPTRYFLVSKEGWKHFSQEIILWEGRLPKFVKPSLSFVLKYVEDIEWPNGGTYQEVRDRLLEKGIIVEVKDPLYDSLTTTRVFPQ